MTAEAAGAARPAPAPDTALRGPWLPIARAAWLAVLVLGLSLLALNIGLQFEEYRTVCGSDPCPTLQFTARQAAELRQLGLSLDLAAAYLTVSSVLQVLVFIVVAAVIYWRKSDDRLGWLMSFTLVAFGITGALTPTTHTPPFQRFLMVAFTALGNSSIVLFFFLFPDGRFVPGWARWLAPFAVAREVLGAFWPNTIFDVLFFGFVPLILLMQVYRYRRVSNAIQQQQTKWVVFGSVLGVGAYMGVLLSIGLYSDLVGPLGALATLVLASLLNLALLLIPLSVGMAILRSHLWDIDLLIRRTLVYGVLTALLALVYFGGVVGLQAILTALTGAPRSELVTVLSTLAIAALAVPLRNRLQAFIDRRFYRRKYDAARTLAEFGASLRDEVELDALSHRLLAVVDETMQPRTVSLWLPGNERPS